MARTRRRRVATNLRPAGPPVMGRLDRIPEHVALAGDLAALLADLESRVRERRLGGLTPAIAAEARSMHEELTMARRLARIPPDDRLTLRLEAIERAIAAPPSRSRPDRAADAQGY